MSLGSQLSGFTSFAPPERNPSATQMSGSSPPTAPRACCENGRPILTDPHTGQTVCSCQYSSALLNYPRVPGLAESVYSASAYAAAVSQGYVSLGAEGSAFYSPLAGSPYDLKDSAEAWRSLAQPPFPYDPAMAVYPYGAGYGGLDLNARRKNATRENTNTLKAWLYEHRKNPYPTKGEKIMLAIITKMTLTQVSTWFANARRRLKKENKMTWSPRNRSEDGSDSVNGESDSEKTGEGNDVSGSHGDLDARLPRDGRSSPGADSDAGGSQERIINVDDEDSNHSFLHNDDDLMDHKPGDDDDDDDDDFAKHSREARSSLGQGRSSPKLSVNDHDKVRSGSPRPCTEVRDSKEEDRGSSPEPKSSSQSERGSSSSGGSGSSTSSSARDADTAPPRPKIWSISEVLQSSGSSSSSSSGPSRPATISTAARPTSHNPPGGYFLLPPTAPSAWAAGVGARYGAMAGYPLSLTHTTLSYPYSLSTHTAAKAALQPPTAVSRSLAGLRGEAEKLTRTNGLFSPARDIDCIRSSVAAGRLVESNI